MAKKQDIRLHVRQSRSNRSSQHGTEFAANLIATALEYGAHTICCFVSTPTEPDTSEFLARSRSAGLRVLLPKSLADGELEWAEYTGELRPGKFGIHEPLGEGIPSSALGGVDLCFVPAAAVDLHGTRLGWGRGFYDRALAAIQATPPAFAVVFENEVFDVLPSEEHDIAVLGAITEKAVHRFG